VEGGTDVIEEWSGICNINDICLICYNSTDIDAQLNKTSLRRLRMFYGIPAMVVFP